MSTDDMIKEEIERTSEFLLFDDDGDPYETTKESHPWAVIKVIHQAITFAGERDIVFADPFPSREDALEHIEMWCSDESVAEGSGPLKYLAPARHEAILLNRQTGEVTLRRSSRER